ncbi:uncharacterized protein LOC117115399 [Anneissia japonica]|uniref:uncharacterized protein LOC117115399 n=1 Tax=Anneissia japonica TaxID=1529436 RepID=UPI001425747E|nr:uncharacterized protein LOC117115399 [Anneissia japonica]
MSYGRVVNINVDMFSPSKSSIKEANEHFQALYKRIDELEKTVKDQAEAIIRRDEDEQQRMNDVANRHKNEVEKLNTNIKTSEKKIEILSRNLQEKNAMVTTLQYKCRMINELCASIPAFESYLTTLKQVDSLRTGIDCNNVSHVCKCKQGLGLPNNVDSMVESNDDELDVSGQTTV